MTIKPDAVAALVAYIAIVGGGFSWLLTMENRITNKATKEALTLEIRGVKEVLRKEMGDDKETLKQSIRELKTELDTDIRIMRDRMYQQQQHPTMQQPTIQ